MILLSKSVPYSHYELPVTSLSLPIVMKLLCIIITVSLFPTMYLFQMKKPKAKHIQPDLSDQVSI